MNTSFDAKINHTDLVSNCCGPGWVDCMIDTCSLDIFGCDENCSNAIHPVVGKPLHHIDEDVQETSRIITPTVDYAKKHDEFLDSLLYEQTLLRNQPQNDISGTEDVMNVSETTLGLAPSSSTLNNDSFSENSDSKCSKPIRLKRRTSPGRNNHKSVAPLRERSPKRKFEPSTTVSLADLSRTEHLPTEYIHPQCRMQKDKGKGEDVGSNICAKGIDQCLEKLRSKMKLLTEHAMETPGESKKAPATMKRRNARVSEIYDNFVETRSLIELRMGFLSMTYGILLRWDTRKTSKVSLVVLRKNCHDTFYPRESKVVRVQQPVLRSQPSNVSSKEPVPQAHTGTEVSLLQPPYRVPRPAQFNPMSLTVDILYATGLSHKSNWTVQLCYENTVENILLTYDPEPKCLTPKLGKGLKIYIPENAVLSSLEIKLFEHRLRRKNQRRLVTCMSFPIASLEAQSSSSAIPLRMRLPCQPYEDASIQSEFLLISDYSCWLQKELEARKLEEMNGLVRQVNYKPEIVNSMVVTPPPVMIEEENEENEDPWDWICSVC